ncbi:lysine exporter LysO family protein [Carboxylicivirga sediminis]|uniref:Lysine exporter LysO family protein n=1 Tax=Carboxylicivirga sediminis TaxID=2006564 RepID=A0A941FBY6_9BACT|nr:lysine exporter LysO family protein [Carboxylicivirga sediminis]MBR8538025.1 lysine exporter LysO family protein [Carboxylicivirga sediminis]
MKGSIIILAFFAVGLLGGIYGLFPEWLLNENLTTYALFVLMFLVGISIGSDKNAFYILRKLNFKVVLVPLTVIIGSLLGTAIISLMLADIDIKEATAVGAGFGYYSLSSIFISQLHSQELGVIALLSNIFREIITLLGVPLLVKYFGKLAGIASGGATAMDTTLPVIVKFTGKEYGIIAIFSGIILTILVPILVTVILEFS